MSTAITREQFAAAVASAVSSVQHLYREVDRLMGGVRDRLAEEPDPLAFIGGAFAKTARDQTRLIIRHEYGALFMPTSGDEDIADEDEEEIEDEGEDTEEEDVGAKSRKRAPAELAADQVLLAMRVVTTHRSARRSSRKSNTQ